MKSSNSPLKDWLNNELDRITKNYPHPGDICEHVATRRFASVIPPSPSHPELIGIVWHHVRKSENWEPTEWAKQFTIVMHWNGKSSSAG